MSNKRFAQAVDFYDVLAQYVNEDGYTLASLHLAKTVIGIPSASAKPIAQMLDEMGCIKLYSMERLPGHGTSELSLMKLITPPTPELYSAVLLKKHGINLEDLKR